MEKMTVSYCSQVPASCVLVLLAALQGTAATINDPNEAAVRGTEPVLAYVESPLRCVSNRSYNGLYMLIKSLVLLWLKWQKGAIVSCPPLLCPVPLLCFVPQWKSLTLALTSASAFGHSWGHSGFALFPLWGFPMALVLRC